MRPLWEGAITFGLILIPVRMFKATEDRKPDFHLVREDDNCPIKYMRVCKSTGEEVPFDKIIKSYEYKKGSFITLDDEDFKKAYSKRTENIEIVQFCPESEIETKYFEQPYYLEPGKSAAKVYSLLREALKKSGMVGVSRYVLHNLEHLGILKAEKDLLILNKIRFQSEIRDTADLNIPPENKLSQKEVETAIMLIDQLSAAFNPADFRDNYTKELKLLIEEKIKTGKISSTEEKVLEKPGEIVDLMSKLKQSLDEARMKKNAS